MNTIRSPRRRARGLRTFHLFEHLENRVLLAVQPPWINGAAALVAQPAAQVATPAAVVAVSILGAANWTDVNGGTHPIPEAIVEIRSTAQANTDPPLATTQTGDSGVYTTTVNVDVGGGPVNLFARIFARSPIADIKPDVGDPNAGKTYFIDSTTVPASAAGTITIPLRTANNTATGEQVFSVHTAMVWAGKYAGYLMGSPPAQIDVRFPTLTRTTSVFTGTQIHILLKDRWDWDPIQHEYGHYVQNANKFSNSAGGSHTFFAATDKPNGPGVAWSEGFATFFSLMGQQTEGEASLGVPDVGDLIYNDTEDSTLNINMVTDTGVSELDEYSVCASLLHLAIGDQGVQITDSSLFSTFVADKPTTLGAAWDDLAKNASGDQRSLIAHVLGLQHAAPVATAPADGDPTTTATIPTFKWKQNGFNDFQIQFFSGDFKTIIHTTADLGDVNSFTPTADEWKQIFDGHSTVKWVVEAKDTTAPETPGSVTDGTFGGSLDRYWSSAGTLNGPGIALVLDVTGSMSDEIDSAKAALDSYIVDLQSHLAPGENAPTVDLIVFQDGASEVISSNDLTAVKAAIDAQSASGGGDCPEPSAASLAYAGSQISSGGTILLITDASSDPGTDLAGTIALLRAKGVTVNAFISGDCSEDSEPTSDASASTMVADADMVGDVDPDFQPTTDPAPTHVTTTTSSTTPSAGDGNASSIATPFSDFGADGEPAQGPITVATQDPIDDFGGDTSTAAQLTVDGAAISGTVGGNVQDGAGGVVADTDDFFVVHLTAGVQYNIPFQTPDSFHVTVNLLDTDGTTQIESLTTQTADNGVSAGLIQFTPTATGDYFLDATWSFSEKYSLRVSTSTIAGVTSSVVLFSTLANSTGGTFFFDPTIANSPTSADKLAYQSAIRNVMDSTFEATVLTATPSQVPAGLSLSVTLAGSRTNWVQGSTLVAFSNASIRVNSITVTSPTSLTVGVTVAAGASVGSFSDVTVTTRLGSVTERAAGSNAVQINAAPSIATLLQVQPTTLSRGKSLTITVLGTMTAWDATSTLALGPGITINSLTVNSATQMTAQVTVDAAAQLGFRIATVTTGGIPDMQDRALIISGTSLANIPTVASLTPSEADDGAHADVTVVGSNTNFQAGVTTADFGPGITVSSIDVTDATHAVVHLDVDPAATPGFRDVTLTTGVETAAQLNGFFVAPIVPATLAGPAAPVAPALPFVAASVPFTVTLASALSNDSTVDFTTADGSAIAGVDYVATTGKLTIPAGQTSATINVPLIARTTSLATDLTLTLTISNPSGGIILGSPSQASGTIAAETISASGFNARTPLVYTGSSGQTVKLLLRGAGTGTAYFVNGSSDPSDIAIDGGTLASSLIISAPIAAPAVIGGVGVNGSLASLIGSAASFNGNSEVSGAIGTVLMGDNASTGNVFMIDTGATPTRFVLKKADGLSIKSAGTIRAITAKSWAVPTGGVAGTITAASLLLVVDTGDFAASMNVSGAIGPVTVLGQISGTWTVGAAGSNIVANHGTTAGWSASFGGNVGVVVGSSLAGSLTASGSIRLLRASGDLSATVNAAAVTIVSAKSLSGDITATGAIQVVSVATSMSAHITAASIGTLAVGGAVTNSQVRASNSINVAVVGSIADSIVFAGVSAGVSTVPTDATDLTNPASQILVFATRVAGGFSNSAIAASTMRTVVIHGAATTSAGGVAATNFGALVFTQSGHRAVVFTTRKANPTVPTLLGTDFEIRLLG